MVLKYDKCYYWERRRSIMDYELAIIGAGPAGYSAGIYAGRSGINAVVLDKVGGGGPATSGSSPTPGALLSSVARKKIRRRAEALRREKASPRMGEAAFGRACAGSRGSDRRARPPARSPGADTAGVAINGPRAITGSKCKPPRRAGLVSKLW